MLTLEQKALIDKEFGFNTTRLTGVFFIKHLGGSMYAQDGQLTELASQALHYFNELKLRANSKNLKRIELKGESELKEKRLESKKAAQQIKKSANLASSSLKSAIQWVLDGDQLIVTLPNNRGINGARFVRQYLKSKGINRLGKTVKDGVSFSNEAVNEIFALFEYIPRQAIERFREIAKIVSLECQSALSYLSNIRFLGFASLINST